MSHPNLFKQKLKENNQKVWHFTITNQLRYGLIFLVVCASLVTAGIVASLSFKTQLKQSINLQQTKSELAAQKVDNYLNDLQQKLKYLARIKGLTNLDTDIQKNLLFALTRHNRAYEFVAIFNRNGEEIASFSPYEKITLNNQVQADFFQRSFQEQQDYIGVVELDQKLHIPVVTFAFPIRNNQDQVDGVLLAKINLKFLGFVVSQSQVGETGYTYIIDNRLFLIASPDNSVNNEQIKDLSSLDYIQKLTPQLLSPESQFLNKYQGLKNVEVLGAIANIPTVNWKVITELPTSEIYQPLREMLISVILTLIIAGLITIIISLLLTKQIVNPLQKLTVTATEIQQGNFNIKLDLKSRNEFGILAQTFNQMVQQLKQSFENLETVNQELENRVKERTQQLEQALVKADSANQAKSKFLTNMSHELRTPLNGILGIAQVLQNSSSLTPQQQDEINIIYQSGSHLLMLISDILDISKIEAGKLEILPQFFSFSQLIKGIFSLCEIQAQAKNIQLKSVIQGELPALIETDETRLRQVLINLLNNAIKFTNKGQVTWTIKVTEVKQNIHQDPDQFLNKIEFIIEDTGIGIAPEKIKIIFFPFEQVSEEKLKTEGTGLGLAISQKLVQMMGGEITVSSTLEKGSIFSFSLQCMTKRLMTEAKINEGKHHRPHLNLNEILNQISSAPSSSNMPIVLPIQTQQHLLSEQIPLKILVAEDNRVNQKIAEKLFKTLGYQVDFSNNGKEVLRSLKQQQYDVIFMDLSMPEMDGLEATKIICQDYNPENRPCIIAMTANAMATDKENCLKIGMDDYLSKPVKIDQLKAMIKLHFG